MVSKRLFARAAACLSTYLKLNLGDGRTDAASLYSFQSYLQGNVGPGCGLSIRFQNLPNWDCWLGMQPVYTVSEPF